MNESKVIKLNEILVKFRGCVFHFSQNKTPNIMGIFFFFFFFMIRIIWPLFAMCQRSGWASNSTTADCGLQLNWSSFFSFFQNNKHFFFFSFFFFLFSFFFFAKIHFWSLYFGSIFNLVSKLILLLDQSLISGNHFYFGPYRQPSNRKNWGSKWNALRAQ